jgi:hypothetical protein
MIVLHGRPGLQEVPGGLQGIITATFEIEGSDRPGCVAEQVFRVCGEAV